MVKLFLAERLRALPKVSQQVSGKTETYLCLKARDVPTDATAAYHTMATSVPQMAW